jgi:hypothetical protein
MTVRPPLLRHPHRAARRATRWSPRPPSASLPAGRGSGTPGPLRSVTSTRITPFSVLTATVTRLAGGTRAAMPQAIGEKLAHQQGGHVPARVPGADYLQDECSGGPRPLRPPARRASRSPGPPPLPSPHPPFPGRPGETGRAPGGRREMHAHLRRERQVGATGSARASPAARPWPDPPSVAVRETADGAHRPS